jgi:hypothetical protein
MAPFCAHRPADLGEWKLQRLLGALHERNAASAPPFFGGPAAMKPLAKAIFVRIAPPLLVSGSCSASWERCTSAEL